MLVFEILETLINNDKVFILTMTISTILIGFGLLL